MKRREWLAAGCALAAGASPLATMAQGAYPQRPVRLVVGFPAGSSTDVAARAVSQRVSDALGQSFVVDNRPGASSNIAAKAVAAAPADGYTLFVGTVANTINVTLQPATSVDLLKDFLPVAMIGSVPNLLVVHPSLNVDSVEQLVRAAKAQPGKIAYASSGNGTSPHLSGELFCMMAGIRMLHVPYKGSSPAVTDLLAGQVGAMFSPASTVLPHIRAGKLKALASTGARRTGTAPDLPTIAELGLAGFETSVWFGVMAPAGTPADVVEKLRAATFTALQAPDLQSQFSGQGIDVVRAGPQEFVALVRAETDKWAKVIQTAGVKPE